MRKTFEILQRHDVHTMTIVTSRYHQKRAQALYGVMAQLCRLQQLTDIRSVGNFCSETDEASTKTPDDRLAIQGMVELLHLPREVLPFTPSPSSEDEA